MDKHTREIQKRPFFIFYNYIVKKGSDTLFLVYFLHMGWCASWVSRTAQCVLSVTLLQLTIEVWLYMHVAVYCGVWLPTLCRFLYQIFVRYFQQGIFSILHMKRVCAHLQICSDCFMVHFIGPCSLFQTWSCIPSDSCEDYNKRHDMPVNASP